MLVEALRSRGASLVRGGLMLAFAAWLGYYVITGMPQLDLHVFRPAVTSHAVTAAAAIAYLLYLSFRRRLPGQTFLDWPVFALLIAYGAATAASINWRVSLEMTLHVVMVTLMFYVAADRDLLDIRQVRRVLLLVIAVAAAYALFQVWRDYWDWLRLARAVEPSWGPGDLLPPTVPRVHGVGDHPNMLAMGLTIGVPFYVVGLLAPGRRLSRLAAAGALVLSGAALFFTLSRAGWVAAAVAAAVATVGWALVTRPDLVRALPLARLGRRRVRLALYALGVVALAALLAGALFLASGWESRPEWLFRGSLSPRLDVMAAGGEMFRDRPLLGTGPGTYPFIYSEYSGAYPVHAVHSHNGYLQAAVDLGLPGVAVMAVLVVVAGGALWRGWRRASPEERLLLVTCGASVAGFMVHSLADAPNASKTALVPLAVVLALVVRTVPPPPVSASEPGGSPDAGGDPRPAAWRAGLWRLWLLPPVTVLVALVALLFFWANIDGAHYHYSRGLYDANAGRWLEAVKDFQRAADEDPEFALYQLELGLSETMAYLDGAPRPVLEQGVTNLERGVALEPRGAIGHANLARAYLLAGRPQEARDSAQETIRWAEQDPVVVMAAAGVLEEAGAAEEARDAYATALALDTSLAFSPFWSGSAFRRDNFDEIVARSVLPLNPCLVGRQMLLPGASPDLDLEKASEDCRLYTLSHPGNVGARVDLATILMAAGERKEALAILDEAVAHHPDDGAVRRALGEWYSAAGDLERARHEWLLGAQLGDPRAAMLLGDSYGPAAVPQEAVRRANNILRSGNTDLTVGGVQIYLLGILYYRMDFGRESPITILVPGDWQEALGGPYAALREALDRWRRE